MKMLLWCMRQFQEILRTDQMHAISFSTTVHYHVAVYHANAHKHPYNSERNLAGAPSVARDSWWQMSLVNGRSPIGPSSGNGRLPSGITCPQIRRARISPSDRHVAAGWRGLRAEHKRRARPDDWAAAVGGGQSRPNSAIVVVFTHQYSRLFDVLVKLAISPIFIWLGHAVGLHMSNVIFFICKRV